MAVSVPVLISSLYESMTETGKEQLFIEQYAERHRASAGAILVLTDFASGRSDILASTRVDPAYISSYQKYYGSINVYLQRLKRALNHPVVQPGEAICPEGELVGSEYYNDYMRPQRIYHSLGMAMILGGSLHVHLGICRPKGQGAFDAGDTAVAEAIADHLRPVMQVRERFLRLRHRAAAWSQLSDDLPFGVVLLNACGSVLEANRYAAAILSAGDGLTCSKGQLSAALPSEEASLRRLLGRALATSQGHTLDPGCALRISRRSLRSSYNVLISPLRAGIPLDSNSGEHPAVLLIVVDPAQDPGRDLSRFSRLYDLTPAEHKVCSLLVQGGSPKGIAAELQITMNTARTHIKRILSKTGTNRQSELMRLALSAAPVRGVLQAIEKT